MHQLKKKKIKCTAYVRRKEGAPNLSEKKKYVRPWEDRKGMLGILKKREGMLPHPLNAM